MDKICNKLEQIAKKNTLAEYRTKAQTKYASSLDKITKEFDKKIAKALGTEQTDEEIIKAIFEAKPTEDTDMAIIELQRKVEEARSEVKDEALASADDVVNDFVDYFLDEPTLTRYVDTVAPTIAPDHQDIARRYTVLYVMNKNEKLVEKKLKEYFLKEKRTFKGTRTAPGYEGDATRNEMLALVKGRVKDQLEGMRRALNDYGVETPDDADVFAEIKGLQEKYEEEVSQPNVVTSYEDGKEVLVEVDPFIANLVKYRYIGSGNKWYQKMAEGLSESPMIIGLNRTARFFQTVANPASWWNQNWRDPSNGVVMAGMRLGMGSLQKELLAEFDTQLVEWLKTNQPNDYAWAEKQVASGDGTMAEHALAMIFSKAKIDAERGTATEFYRTPKYQKEEDYFGSAQITAFKTQLGEVYDKFMRVIEMKDQPREAGVRLAVFKTVFQDSLKHGRTVEEARQAAQFASDNATTNYDRMLTHFENLRRTVNYFGAGVNGFKSFWRMFELDPVGIMTRMTSGVLVPVIVATVVSLMGEKDRQAYRQIKEHEKNDHLVFVLNGVVYSIPVPQEMGLFINMTRSSVESLFDGNRHAFWELAMNNLLGVGPIEFDAFLDIDVNQFGEDPDFWDRIGALGISLVDQVAPNFAKNIFELTTGIDTYTGRPIDTSYYLFDDDGQRVPTGGTASAFALKMGRTFGVSPAVLAHTTKNLIGQVGLNILDAVIGGDGDLFQDFGEAMAPVKTSDYDRVASDWNQEISALWRKKEALLGVYNDYNSKINAEANLVKKDNLRRERQNLIDPFLKEVKNAVLKLKKNYPGEYDRYRFAAVVSLLTFDTGTNRGDTAEQQLIEKELFYANRDKAYQWMSDLGIGEADDSSILGYYTVDKNGNPTVRYNTPVEILAAREALYGSADRNVAELTLAIADKKNELKASQQAVYDYRSNVFASNKPYNTKKKLIDTEVLKYNAQVAKAIAPFIEKMTPEAVLRSDAVIDYLEDWFIVPLSYEVNDRGKSTSSLGSNASKQDAYIKHYIQDYFGANL